MLHFAFINSLQFAFVLLCLNSFNQEKQLLGVFEVAGLVGPHGEVVHAEELHAGLQGVVVLHLPAGAPLHELAVLQLHVELDEQLRVAHVQHVAGHFGILGGEVATRRKLNQKSL